MSPRCQPARPPRKPELSRSTGPRSIRLNPDTGSPVERVRTSVAELGGESIEVMDSPLLGAEGNKEFLLHARWG